MPEGSRATRHRVSVGFVLLTFLSSIMSGGVPPVAAGATNAALLLNGTTQYATLGNASQLRSATFTVELWVKRATGGATQSTGTGGITAYPLVTKGRAEAETAAADVNYFVGIDGTGHLAADFEEAQTGASPSLNHPITGTAVIPLGEWHHVAATYDGSTWNLYVVGALDATLSVGRPANAATNVVTALGTSLSTAVTPAPLGFFSGAVDEVRIWNVARTLTQIQAEKNNEFTGTSPNLLARYGLNEGVGTSFGDSSGNNIGGTTVANPAWTTQFVPPAPGNAAPNAPTVNGPTDGATGVSTSPTLDVGVSDPDGDPLTVTFFGRPFASGNFTQIGQNTAVPSSTNTTTSWPNIGAGQKFEWYVTVADAGHTTTGTTRTFTTAAGSDPVFVGAGDIADCTRSQDEATGAVIAGVLGNVWTAGDNAYQNGTATEFANCYDPAWGAVKARTRPAPGNHDWNSGNLDGYNGYFGSAATDVNGKSYYSYDIAASNWHVVVLDTECARVTGGCGAGSAQELWLRADLSANSTKNVITVWHKPRYSSAVTNLTDLQPFYDDLYAFGVDILLQGHDHVYERMDPMNAAGVADPAYGVRQFTVGTGGASLQSCGTLLPNSVKCGSPFGVLKFTLHASSYDWVFLPIAGTTFDDSGTASVHDAPPAQSFTSIPISTGSGEKPQSKLWQHDGTWWGVFPSTGVTPSGTWLWKLNPDDTWTNVLRLSSATDTKADAKRIGDVTHILLHGAAPQLVSLEYVPADHTYQLWSTRPAATSVTLPNSETATIDIDSGGRMWLATENGANLNVYYSDSPYSSFTGPIALATNINDDDIGVVTALPNHTIGVLWSNQNTKRFGFKTHTDGADPNTWSADEVPASQSAIDNVGLGMADDHLNVAVATDGTLYAAVKTSYDTAGYPKIALLIRRPNGSWDPLYEVDQNGTRGIVLLNESDDTVRVVYTSAEGFNDLVVKESPTAAISFGSRQTLISGGVNDATSTKDNWTGRVPVVAASATVARTAFLDENPPAGSDLRGNWRLDEGGGASIVDSSIHGNDGTISGNPTWVPGQHGLAMAFDGIGDVAQVPDDASLNLTTGMTIAAWIRPGLGATQDVVKKATNGSLDGYELSLASPTSAAGQKFFVRLNQVASGDTYRVNSTANYPTDGTWVHVAATYDGTTIRLYIDGVLDASAPGPAAIATNSVPLSIGGQNGGTRLFTGAVDDVFLYDRALSVAEIQALAAPPAGDPPPEPPTGLVASASRPGIGLTWDANGEADLAGYNVYRSTSPGVSTAGSPINNALITGTGYLDSEVTDGVTYYYVVTAVDDGANESTASNEDSATGIGSGLRLGTSSYVTFGDPSKLDLAQFTIETWFKRTGTGVANTTGTGGIDIVPLLTHGAPQAEGSNVDANWMLGINTAGNVIAADFEAIDDPGTTGQNIPISGTTPITNNVWHHAAATFDGTTWAVYLDGNLEASSTPGVHPRSDSIQHVALGTMIESDGTTTHGRFDGVIDEARVWNVARSGAQILATKDLELTAGTGLIARWA
jgi:hypothetical protein